MVIKERYWVWGEICIHSGFQLQISSSFDPEASAVWFCCVLNETLKHCRKTSAANTTQYTTLSSRERRALINLIVGDDVIFTVLRCVIFSFLFSLLYFCCPKVIKDQTRHLITDNTVWTLSRSDNSNTCMLAKTSNNLQTKKMYCISSSLSERTLNVHCSGKWIFPFEITANLLDLTRHVEQVVLLIPVRRVTDDPSVLLLTLLWQTATKGSVIPVLQAGLHTVRGCCTPTSPLLLLPQQQQRLDGVEASEKPKNMTIIFITLLSSQRAKKKRCCWSVQGVCVNKNVVGWNVTRLLFYHHIAFMEPRQIQRQREELICSSAEEDQGASIFSTFQ